MICLGYTSLAAVCGFWWFAVDYQDDSTAVREVIESSADFALYDEMAR